MLDIDNFTDGTIIFLDGKQITVYHQDDNILVENPDLTTVEYTKEEFKDRIKNGVIVFNEPSQKIMESNMYRVKGQSGINEVFTSLDEAKLYKNNLVYQGHSEYDIDIIKEEYEGSIFKEINREPEYLPMEKKVHLLSELQRIAKEYPDVHVRQQALSFLNDLGMQYYDNLKEIEEFIDENTIEFLDESMTEYEKDGVKYFEAPRYSVVSMDSKDNKIIWDKDFDDPREAVKYMREKSVEEPEHVLEVIDTVKDIILTSTYKEELDENLDKYLTKEQLIKEVENGNLPDEYVPRDIGQGYGYKIDKSWEEIPGDDIVIYIPEYGYGNFDEPDGMPEKDSIYTKNDFREITKELGKRAEEEAQYLFQVVDWQHPESLWDEMDTDEEDFDESLNEEQDTYTVYVYNEETNELEDTLKPNDMDSLKTMLYNLSDKDNGYIVSLKPITNFDENTKKNSDDFKFHCKHIYENNGNFLCRYTEEYVTDIIGEVKLPIQDDFIDSVELYETDSPDFLEVKFIGKKSDGKIIPIYIATGCLDITDGTWITGPSLLDNTYHIKDKDISHYISDNWFNFYNENHHKLEALVQEIVKGNVVPLKEEVEKGEYFTFEKEINTIATDIETDEKDGFEPLHFGNWKLTTSLDDKWETLTDEMQHFMLREISFSVRSGHLKLDNLSVKVDKGLELSKSDLESLGIWSFEEITNTFENNKELETWISYEITFDENIEGVN